MDFLHVPSKSFKQWYQEGIAFFNQNNYSEAIHCFERAIQLNPRNASALNALGITYSKTGDMVFALDALERAIEISPKNDTIRNNRDRLSKNFQIYTIGHSNHPIEEFIGILRKHSIDTVIDVRSYPFSKYQHQYNRENLKKSLKEANIAYEFLGDHLGGRCDDPKYKSENGNVNYNKMKTRPEFQEGLRIVKHRIEEGKRMALMCSEKDPFDCHRFLLVSKNLNEQGVYIGHILNDGEIISQKSMEELLKSKYPYFPDENLDFLYDRRNEDIFNKKPKPQHIIKKATREPSLSDY